MTPLEPSEVTTLVAQLTDLLARGVRAGGGSSGVRQRRESLDVAYRWVHGAAYGLGSSSPAASTVCRFCHGTLEIQPPWPGAGKRCEECAPGRSDRTGDAVANRQPGMVACAAFSAAMREALAQVTKARKILQASMESDRDPIPTPRTEPLAGVREAEAAQQRRIERGENMP